MLSLNQAIEIKESILAYLKATFTFHDKEVHKAFYEFINHPTDGMFKGPYVSLKLPFVKADSAAQESIPLTIKPSWLPYDHQIKAWHRLSSVNQKPQPTIITTGTGSGKTESFVFPLLDYCYRNLTRPGIKVIILYPMNALATDQAKRLAEAIYGDDRIRGKVTAGLFIGEGKDASKYPKSMGADHIIENRESILASPPDILLTNFKMLDYGLMKSRYNDLWLANYKEPTLLQFLVLDELHTYDGAQGTDVANLIRRLKLKLNVPENHLCPVGTSATIGSGVEAPQLLSEYACKIFGENVTPDCIITENRVSALDFFASDDLLEPFTPRISVLKDVKPRTSEGYESYIERQMHFWQLDRNRLAEGLASLKIVKDLISVVNEDKGIHTLDRIVQKLSNRNGEYRKIPQWDAQYLFNPKENIVISLFALISEAKVADPKTGRQSPFLYMQIQLWIRELSGVLREMTEVPTFTWKAEGKQKQQALPPWFCRDCGASGWLGIKHDNKERFEKDIADVYAKYFSNHKHIYFANRTSEFNQKDALEGGYEPTDSFQKFIVNSSFEFYTDSAEDRTNITAFRKLDKNNRNEHICPECNTKNTLAIIGTRIATLSSISVSQILSTDLDKQSEQFRKVLAFTNSVQDAAHQAGFVEARNYRFTFRASLQKVINEQNGITALNHLADQFITYWKQHSDESGNKPLDAYYYRFFPSDYIGKCTPKDYQDASGTFEPHFQKEFDHRIFWEVYSEFGYNAQIGRTLEKTGSSAILFAQEDLNKTWLTIQPWLQANETTRTIDQLALVRFVNMLLHRIRMRGAVDHLFLQKFREHDLKLWDLNWMSDSRHFLHHKFSPRSRIPKLVATHPDNRGILDSTFAKTSNWFHAYFKKTFQQTITHTDFINEFYEQLLKALADSGIMVSANTEDKQNYALNPAQMWVSKDVAIYECTQCGHVLTLGASDTDLQESKCLAFRCQGVYKLNRSIEKDNYYQLVYNRNRSPRIYAADHTGLLERKVRENLELDFKTRPNFNSKNAMVATSTLEMGIDIGDLNSAINNSIPPQPSNFLQRVGRAGRASGSALIVNFVKSQSHDLYYNTDPLEMMAGEINTPGCYLEAKEILKRHFFAFCIDSWAKVDPVNHGIPYNIRSLQIETTDLLGERFFLNQILSYIKVNENVLFQNFRNAYGTEVKAVVFDHLRKELDNDAFYQFHKSIFPKLKNEIQQIKKIRVEIDQRIQTLNLGKEDPERVELDKEIKNLHGIIQSIRKRNTLEHLTNVGALPNYAFPETGVELTAKVLGNKAEGSSHTPLNKDFDIVRSASQALKEFAPDNSFYSQGFKFRITGVNTLDWADRANFHKKRFCSNCDHIELDSKSNPGNCPKCGDESWGAASNVHTYAKMLAVKSFNNQSDASINDSNDERDKLPYKVIQHFHFPEHSSRGALAMKEIPFGIEFFSEVRILEENLGRSDVADPRKVKINGVEMPRHGFITCRHCGKSSSHVRQKVNGKDYKFHYAFCKYKDKDYNGCADEVFEEVFYFREIQTEALKVLLPVQEVDGESEIRMYQAGIEHGLKKYFKGNPQHIRIALYREYNHTTSKFDRYLVMYDSIPGGTGYLEKIFDGNAFEVLLKGAYESIKNCACQHYELDGCYHCIYTYSNQYYHAYLSRSLAEKRFGEIVNRVAGWDRHVGSLASLTNAGNIEESELEERFVRSLKKLASQNNHWSMQEVNDDGTVSYTLSYTDSVKNIGYHIRPQVDLGPNDGIKFHTKPDFLMICTHCEIDQVVVEDKSSLPRIAVYLDGYQFHASTEHNSFHNDLEKRKGIVKSKNHLSWTLTWHDVELFDKYLGDDSNGNGYDSLQNRLHNSDEFKASQQKLSKSVKRDVTPLKNFDNNFSRMLELLKSIDSIQKLQGNIALYFAYFQQNLFTPSFAPDRLDQLIQKSIDTYCIKNKTLDGLVPVDITDKNSLFEMNLAVNIQQGSVLGNYRVYTPPNIDKDLWNQFWSIFNLIQFYNLNENDPIEIQDEIGGALNELLATYPTELHSIISRLHQTGKIRSPQDDVQLNSLLDENGNICAEAELVIHTLKMVLNPCSRSEEKVFIKNGYTCVSLDELKDIAI